MKTLLFLLLSISVSAQLTTVPKVIYKATKTDTINCGFSSIGNTQLKVSVDNEVKEDVFIVGYHTLDLILDSGSVVVAQCKGQLGYTIYRNGVNVTPAVSNDNTSAELITLLDGLSIAQYRKRVNKLLIKYLSRKELK